VGLGLNRNELNQNTALTLKVIQDLNKDPVLPFPTDTFDAVINTVSVDYLVQPIDVFKRGRSHPQTRRTFFGIFSNRMFPEKAVKIWQESTEEERVILVEEFFRLSKAFEPRRYFVSKKKSRPKDDKYACLGIPSDPIYAVYAEKNGGDPNRKKDRMLQWPMGNGCRARRLN